MLGTLIDKLESLFSKRFVIASVPLLAFLLVNGLMAYQVSATVQRWVDLYFSLDAPRLAVVSFAALMIVVVLTYVSSALGVFLREVLEGRYLPGWMANALTQRYRSGLAAVERDWQQARRAQREIRAARGPWRLRIGAAYQTGATLQPAVCNYQRPPALTELLDRRDRDADITHTDLQPVIDVMVGLLQTNSPQLQDDAASIKLDDDEGALLQLIDYARDKWEAKVVDRLNEIQFDYAGKNVAPTRMGLIARAAPYYAQSRYSMNLGLVWPRLQKILQADATFYPVMQDAKMYVDFLIALLWLTATFTITWVVLLPIQGTGPYLFVVIAVLGPLLTLVWYRIALQNYRAMSELVRASIDLYRLDLLKTLRLGFPANAEQERTIWETLEQRLGYGEHVNVSLHSS